LPIVVKHGDFSITNCLFDPRSRHLGVVVDWDFAEQCGLPLLDAMRFLLHLDSHSRPAQGPSVERAFRGFPDVVFNPSHRDLYNDYLRALHIEDRLFVPLAVMYWVQLVDNHYPVHRCRWNVSWSHQNVRDVLQKWVEHLKL
jgi:aminoglycoside phosphotransferase (APT) family kinase protein